HDFSHGNLLLNTDPRLPTKPRQRRIRRLNLAASPRQLVLKLLHNPHHVAPALRVINADRFQMFVEHARAPRARGLRTAVGHNLSHAVAAHLHRLRDRAQAVPLRSQLPYRRPRLPIDHVVSRVNPSTVFVNTAKCSRHRRHAPSNRSRASAPTSQPSTSGKPRPRLND